MWHDLGSTEQFSQRPLTAATIGRLKVVVTHQDGQFGVINGVCNHAGGPLADGRLDGEYVVCPWHNWKYHCRTGLGEPGYEADAVPRYDVKIEDGKLFASESAVTKRSRGVHPPHPLARKVERGAGPVRVVGTSAPETLRFPKSLHQHRKEAGRDQIECRTIHRFTHATRGSRRHGIRYGDSAGRRSTARPERRSRVAAARHRARGDRNRRPRLHAGSVDRRPGHALAVSQQEERDSCILSGALVTVVHRSARGAESPA